MGSFFYQMYRAKLLETFQTSFISRLDMKPQKVIAAALGLFFNDIFFFRFHKIERGDPCMPYLKGFANTLFMNLKKKKKKLQCSLNITSTKKVQPPPRPPLHFIKKHIFKKKYCSVSGLSLAKSSLPLQSSNHIEGNTFSNL